MKATKILAGALLAMTLAGCGGMTTRERNTVIGAGVGAAAGAAVTGNTAGTVGGAAIGGVIGHEVHH